MIYLSRLRVFQQYVFEKDKHVFIALSSTDDGIPLTYGNMPMCKGKMDQYIIIQFYQQQFKLTQDEKNMSTL